MVSNENEISNSVTPLLGDCQSDRTIMKSRAPLNVVGFLKTFMPAFIMLSMAPQTLILWIGWRVVSFLMPLWLYQHGEDAIYGLYQRMVLFFFEHVAGVEVC